MRARKEEGERGGVGVKKGPFWRGEELGRRLARGGRAGTGCEDRRTAPARSSVVPTSTRV